MKKALYVVFASLILVLAGFGCMKSPEQIVENAKKTLVGQESLAFKVTLKGDSQAFGESNSTLQGVAPGSDEVELSLSGKVDRSSEGVGNMQAELSADVEGEDPFTMKGEFRVIDQTAYAMISDLGSVSDVDGFDLSGMTNKWVSFSSLDELKMEGEEEDAEKLTDEQIKQLEKAFAEFSLFSDAKEEGSEEMHGVKTTKFSVTFDKAGIVDFAKKVSKITEEEFTDKDKEELEEAVDMLNSGKTYVWIGDKDGQLHKVESNPKVKDDEGMEHELSLTAELYDFGEEVNIDVPADAMSFEELFASMLGGMFGGMMGDMDGMFGDMEDFDEDNFDDMFGGMDDGSMEDFDMSEFEEMMKDFEM